MCSTRWYILAVAALIAAVYVSTQCRARYWPGSANGIVVDSWTGKAYQQVLINDEGNEVDWPPNPWEYPEIIDDCCEGDAMEQLPELQSVVPLPRDGDGVPVDEQEVKDFPVWHYKGSTDE